MRAVVEGDLSATARRVVKRATETGWNVVGVVSDGTGESAGQVVLSLRGRRPGGRFVVVFLDGRVDGVWWWTHEHRAVVPGYREVEHVVKLKAWSWNVGKKLVRDEELDEVVTWRTPSLVRTRLASLSELVGVAGGKAPRPGLLDEPVIVLDERLESGSREARSLDLKAS